ncbi:MAG: hypothetical protein O9333_08060 [Beijerinckiaceae bacterium]|jgi:hypothetical protein|nr:hypothetical protein [Beijerinckiaceae bacterium]
MKTAAILAFWNGVRVATVAAVMFAIFAALGTVTGAAAIFLLN